MQSQMRYIVTIFAASGKCNIIHYPSSKCRWVTRKYLIPEDLVLLCAIDDAFFTQSTLLDTIGRSVLLEVFADSTTALNFVAPNESTIAKAFILILHLCNNPEIVVRFEISLDTSDGLTKMNIFPSAHLCIQFKKIKYFKFSVIASSKMFKRERSDMVTDSAISSIPNQFFCTFLKLNPQFWEFYIYLPAL